jgi:hypothetical protein
MGRWPEGKYSVGCKFGSFVRKNEIFYVTACDSGSKGSGVPGGGGVALRRTAGHGHSVVYRGTTGNLTVFMCRLSWRMGSSTFWNPQGLSRPVMGLLYLTLQRDEATNKQVNFSWREILERDKTDTHTHTQTGNTPGGENLVTFSNVLIPCNSIYLSGLFIPGS